MADEKKEEKMGAEVGKITHFYSKLGVGIVELTDTLKTGDQIKINGHSTDIEQSVDTIQIDHKDVPEANKGDVIGIKVTDKVREGDKVYKAE